MKLRNEILKNVNRNTSPEKIGRGDFYGTGIKNKTARARDVFMYGADRENLSLSDPENYPKSL